MTEQEKKIKELEETISTLETENDLLKEENAELEAALKKASKNVPEEKKNKKYLLSSEINIAEEEPEEDE